MTAEKNELPRKATPEDHSELVFWLWSCLHDGQAYLNSYQQMRAIVRPAQFGEFDPSRPEQMFAALRLQRLRGYHFITTVGMVVKHLTRLSSLFPTVQTACTAAKHLNEEGLYLRNMVEHADKNLEAATRNRPRGGFERKSSLLENDLPGDARGSVDAVSTIVDRDGHWLGGRLNVQKTISEVRVIYEAVLAVPVPMVEQGSPPTTAT